MAQRPLQRYGPANFEIQRCKGAKPPEAATPCFSLLGCAAATVGVILTWKMWPNVRVREAEGAFVQLCQAGGKRGVRNVHRIILAR